MKTGINNAIKTGLVALGFFGILVSTANAAYFDYAPAPKCDVSLTRTLTTGNEGVDVTILQDFLNRAGYLSVVPNGHYGPATTAAVRAFQSHNYIPVTGTVGMITRNAINERMCDTDLRADSYSTSYIYGYTSGVTYVEAHDPFVQVVTPTNNASVVYTNPGNTVAIPTYTTTPVTSGASSFPAYAPATTVGGTTNIIYSPTLGYTYGITPASGALAISTPLANATYRVGDTVTMAWTTSNLSAQGYTILLENTSTNQSTAVTSTTGNSVSFVLTQELLDKVCSGVCNSYNYGSNVYQGSFRFVVTTPYKDMAGIVSTFRAAVAPITIFVPNANFGTVSITANKNPVNTNELFKLYVNIPTGASWDSNIYGQYSFKIRATCPAGTTVTIAGVQCGNEFVIPFAPVYFQSEIPASIVNTSWFKQDVTFTLTVTDLSGRVLKSSTTTVSVNPAPINW